MDILIVEDNKELADLLCDFLRAENYTVSAVQTAEKALLLYERYGARLVVLDIMLPDKDGFYVLEKIRRSSNTPVLIVSAKTEKEDKLTGLNLGADDYIEKPYDIDIMLAKISGIFKRRYALDEITDGNIRINKASRAVYKNEKELEMTTKEFELLLLLMENKGRALSKEYIFEQVWGNDSFSEQQTLTVHIKWLRQKIDDAPKKPKKIVTVWGWVINMKAFNRIFSVVAVAVILLFAVVNLILAADKTNDGRLYRVEISRLAREIEANGSADISECEYVTNIERFGKDFYIVDSDYVISEINGELYRFDYNINGSSNKMHLTGIVNAILGIMSILIITVMLYIKFAVLAPFERLSSIPYELSKGNLTAPIKETKNRFFGKFLWGIDILRENIEQQKQRELEMQKEKKTLLLSLSHDIKTPLSAIKLYSAALSKNLYSDAEKQHKIAESINEKADEIEGYVSQIIAASKEDFLSLEVNTGEFYLSELVEKIMGYYREKLALIKTDFIIGKYKNCLLSGDLSRSVEVMQNIMENALKYGDGRRVELIFPEDDECVQIAITNGGCTLAKDDLPHIFESFWRGANAGNIGGNGLGLYICRQLMRKMNGEIFANINGDIITVTAVFARA